MIRKLKRAFLLLAAVFAVGSANAWTPVINEITVDDQGNLSQNPVVLHQAKFSQWLTNENYSSCSEVRKYTAGTERYDRPMITKLVYNDQSLFLTNLQTGTTYDDKTVGGKNVTFTTAAHPPMTLLAPVYGTADDFVNNFRDLGGWKLIGDNNKRTKFGVFFRSAHWDEYKSSTARRQTCPMNREFHIKTEIDLRRDASVSDPETGYVKANTTDNIEEEEYMDKNGGPHFTSSPSVSDDSVRYFNITIGDYFQKAPNNSTCKGLKKIFHILGKKEYHPVVFHCAGGKDRTGYVAILIEALCGMYESDIYRDHLATCFANASNPNKNVDHYLNGVNNEHNGIMGSEFNKYGASMAGHARAYLESIGVTEEEISVITDALTGEDPGQVLTRVNTALAANANAEKVSPDETDDESEDVGGVVITPVTDAEVLARGGDDVYMVTENGVDYYVHRFTSTDSAKTFVNNSGKTLNIRYLVVGGGGAGGDTQSDSGYGGGGGGGGGGVLGRTTIMANGESWNIYVGKGGSVYNGAERVAYGAARVPAEASAISNSTAMADIATAPGGGAGSTTSGNTPATAGAAGGGGAARRDGSTGKVPGAGTFASECDGETYGMNGGGVGGPVESTPYTMAGGGGGAAKPGCPGGKDKDGHPVDRSGDGGMGIISDISGVGVMYGAGGGGGGTASIDPGNGANNFGRGGTPTEAAQNGAPNTGCGGGGAGDDMKNAASGGSGIVIIRYEVSASTPSPTPSGEGKLAEGGDYVHMENIGDVNYWIHEFSNGTANVTFKNTSGAALDVDYLVVGGGGAGGSSQDMYFGGGGGGGGQVTDGTASIGAGITWAVAVGKGGTAPDSGAYRGVSGDSSISGTGINVSALGGGAGACAGADPTATTRATGGGGAGDNSTGAYGQCCPGAAGSSFGGAGGSAVQHKFSWNESAYAAAGGGGGAGGAGQDGSYTDGAKSGNGGAGVSSSITGTSVWYGGGGGAGGGMKHYWENRLGQSDFSYEYGVGIGNGVDGGGNGGWGYYSGSSVISQAAQDGVAGTGGGGGGAGSNVAQAGNGGSGIVIIRYVAGEAPATQKYTLTITQVDNCTITVENNGVAVSSGDQFDEGTILTVNRVPASGYQLDNCKAEEEITMDTDREVTAAVSLITYTATFKSEGATFATQANVTQATAPAPAPTKSGCNFVGWKVGGMGNVVTFPYTLTADTIFVAYFEQQVTPGPTPSGAGIFAKGGDNVHEEIIDDVDYVIHEFYSGTGSMTFENTNDVPMHVEYLVVGGGGAGGDGHGNYGGGGGGGGGGVLSSTATIDAHTTWRIYVGAGGSVTDANGNHIIVNADRGVAGGSAISNSTDTAAIAAVPGGGAGASTSTASGKSGAAGGGGSGRNDKLVGLGHEGTYASSIDGEVEAVHNGADGSLGNSGAGGGGGAAGDGVKGTASASGAGGAGLVSAITGTLKYYGCGGGGGGKNGVAAGAGGSAGASGGNGGLSGSPAQPGLDRTGSGGGGGYPDQTKNDGVGSGAAGGNGIVVIRYVVDSTPAATHTVSFVKNGTKMTDNAVVIAHGGTLEAADIPDYGVGSWDSNPTNATISSDMTYRFSSLWTVSFEKNESPMAEDDQQVSHGQQLLAANIPNYGTGSWDSNPTNATITGNTTYRFTSHWKVTFTRDTTNTLSTVYVPNGQKIPSGSIPAIMGSGSWDSDPSAAEITGDTAFNYTTATTPVDPDDPVTPTGGQRAEGGYVSQIDQNGKHYYVHTFSNMTAAQTFVNTSGADLEVEYLVVGGGAGGDGYNNYCAGGGGGGGVVASDGVVPANGSWSIYVGEGGHINGYIKTASLPSGGSAISNASSQVAWAPGGGSGASAHGNDPATSGASGGGAACQNATKKGTGISGYGHDGGDRYNDSSRYGAGGGGGADSKGGDGTSSASGDGGIGIMSSITGVEIYYGCGGGGSGKSGTTADRNISAGNGGFDGVSGGNGSAGTDAQSGIDGTGCGGGGAYNDSTSTSTDSHAGNGGDGIVIIRYEGVSVPSFNVTFLSNTVHIAGYDTTVISNGHLTVDAIPAWAGGTWDVSPFGATIICATNFNCTVKEIEIVPMPFPVIGADLASKISFTGLYTEGSDTAYVAANTTATLSAVDVTGKTYCGCWRDDSTGELFWGETVTVSPTKDTTYTACFGPMWSLYKDELYDRVAANHYYHLNNGIWDFKVDLDTTTGKITVRKLLSHASSDTACIVNFTTPVMDDKGVTNGYAIAYFANWDNDNNGWAEVFEKSDDESRDSYNHYTLPKLLLLPVTTEEVYVMALRHLENMEGVLCIPENTKLYKQAFAYCYKLEGLIFKGGVDGGQTFPIAHYWDHGGENWDEGNQFENCTSLAGSVVLPKSITYIPPNCFHTDKSLQEIDLTYVTNVSNRGLYDCHSLTNAIGLEALKSVTFMGCCGCWNLKGDVTFTNLESGCFCAFANCGFTSVKLPAATEFHYGVFANNPDLTNIVFSSDVVTFGYECGDDHPSWSYKDVSGAYCTNNSPCWLEFPGMAPIFTNIANRATCSIIFGEQDVGNLLSAPKELCLQGDWDYDPEGWQKIYDEIGDPMPYNSARPIQNVPADLDVRGTINWMYKFDFSTWKNTSGTDNVKAKAAYENLSDNIAHAFLISKPMGLYFFVK